MKKYKTRNNFLIFYNVSILIVNIYLLIRYNINKITLKNIDSYIFSDKIIPKSFYKNKLTNLTKQKKISLYCEDKLNNLLCSNNYKNFLEQFNYIVEIDDIHPDYLIYDVFGCKHTHKKYKNSIKIASYSENIIPDFSEADYSVSQAHIIYLDRYFKYPSFIWRLRKLKKFFGSTIGDFIKNKNKTKFCAAVISNANKNSLFRIKFIKKLNKYKKIDMGGGYHNNVGGTVKYKISFLSEYKFSISMENTCGDGYIDFNLFYKK